MVDLLLQHAHLCHECVEVRIGLGHEQANLVESVQHRLGLGHTLLHIAQDILVRIQLRLLAEDADGVAGAEQAVAVAEVLGARHDL